MGDSLQEQFDVTQKFPQGEDIKLQAIGSDDPGSPGSNRSWTERTFGRMDAGSLRGSIFSMISTAIGAGCLALPIAFKYVGVILGPFFLLLGLFISYSGVLSIAEAADQYKTYHYPKLVEKALGKAAGLTLEIIMIIYIIGTILAYQIIIGEFIPNVMASINADFPGDRIILMIVFCGALMMPLSMIRDLSGLRFVSVLSAVTLSFITLLIVGQFPYFQKENDYSSDLVYAKVDLYLFSAYSMSLWAYTCHTNVSQIQGEMKNSNIRRMKKTTRRGLFFLLFPYLALALFGYLSTLENTPSLIVLRNAPSDINNDWLMVLARVLMSITLVFAVPINLPPCRNSLAMLVFKIDMRKGPMPFKQQDLFSHMGISIGILILTCIVAIVYPNILFMFNFLGGLCANAFVLVFPSNLYLALLRIHLSGKPVSNWKNVLNLVACVVFTIFGLISIAITFV